MKWIQRPPGTAFPESPATEYHGCLDALIATIRDMHLTRDALRDFGYSGPALLVHQDANLAQDRAAICAGMLFDRWIEEAPAECAGCRSCITATGVKDERLARLHASQIF